MDKHPVYDAIMARRSIRSFQSTPVKHEDIQRLLEAAMAAPSACNLQPWAFIVVDQPEPLARIKAVMPQGNYNAPLAVVVCGATHHIPWDGDGWLLDCGAAAQNMMLAANELGLASVCIGGYDEDALRAELTIPDGIQIACVIQFGYPAYQRPPLTWYTDEAVHWQRYNEQKPRVFRTMEMLQDDIASGKL